MRIVSEETIRKQSEAQKRIWDEGIIHGPRKIKKEPIRKRGPVYPKTNDEIRELVLNHYGHKCACPGCDVTEPKWLTIDHINGDGAYYRKKMNTPGGIKFYRWLVSHDFPNDPPLQLLCYNCNCSKGFYGECPHMKRSK